MAVEDKRYTRRWFNKAALLTSSGVAFFPQDTLNSIMRNSEVVRSPEQERKTAEIFGVHGPPIECKDLRDPAKVVRDAGDLGAKSIVLLTPTDQILQILKRTGIIFPITRVYSPDNALDSNVHYSKCEDTMKVLKRYLRNPMVQVANEVNLLKETAGMRISGRQHAADLLPYLRMIAEYEAIPLLTPLAQGAVAASHGENEDRFFDDMLAYLGEKKDDVPGNLAVSVHGYTVQRGENPWIRIGHISDKINSTLGRNVSIVITEAGFCQNQLNPSEESEQETLNYYSTSVPPMIPVSHACLWLLSDEDQRKNGEAHAETFEGAALVGKFGRKRLFNRLASLMFNSGDNTSLTDNRNRLREIWL